MSFTVAFSISPPSGTPPLDRLQGERLAAIIGRVVDHAREAVSFDGSHVVVVDRWLGCHPGGAMVALVLDAVNAEQASEASRVLIEDCVQGSAALVGWTVSEIETERVLMTGGPNAQPPS